MLVVTDSAAALPEHIQSELGIAVVPIMLSLDGHEIAEGSLGNSALADGSAKVTTSAPTPGAYLSAFERPEASDGCLVITVSAKLSGCFQSATLAAGLAPVPVVVVDSQNAAGGQALVALAAARALHESEKSQPAASPQERLQKAVAAAEKVASKVRLVGVLAGVQHLARTGRIPAWAGWVADKAGVKPVFEIRGGEIKRLLPTHSIGAAHSKIVQALQQSRPKSGSHSRDQNLADNQYQPDETSRELGQSGGSDQELGDNQDLLHVCAVHSQAPQDAAGLLDKVCSETNPATYFVSGFGDALVAAAGPGVSGLAWWWEET